MQIYGRLSPARLRITSVLSGTPREVWGHITPQKIVFGIKKDPYLEVPATTFVLLMKCFEYISPKLRAAEHAYESLVHKTTPPW